jgi:hypothetical protein
MSISCMMIPANISNSGFDDFLMFRSRDDHGHFFPKVMYVGQMRYEIHLL